MNAKPLVMKNDYLIVMADIVASRELDQAAAMKHFQQLVNIVNKKSGQALISPLTITLGDEFQGIVRGISDLPALVFELEEQALMLGTGFKLRYVFYEGKIDTPINHEVAHGMMGTGLTHAREELTAIKRTAQRFNVFLGAVGKSAALNNALLVFQEIVDSWRREQDHQLILAFLTTADYKQVAENLKKDRSLVWRRKKSLRIAEYLAIKKVLEYLAQT